MARILYYTTHGTDDPTRAGLAFIPPTGPRKRATNQWWPSSVTAAS